MIGHDFFLWRSLLIIMPKMAPPVKRLSSSIANISFGFSYEENIDPRSKSKFADKLLSKLRELITVCQQNLHHIQKLQKQAYNKGVKPQSYAPGDKIWLSSKHLITKRNCKLKAKFLGLFLLLYPVDKQVYKLKLRKKWKIHNVFHVSLLE